MRNISEVQFILGKQIKASCVTIGLTQDDLAAKAGIIRALVGQIERSEENVIINK